MELGRSWFLLVTVGLLGGAQAQVPLAELSDLQNKAVTLAAENLHSKTFVNKRFQIFSVLEAEQGDYSAGIFVRLNLLKKQTDCPKTQWEGRECRAVNNGRVFDCSVCAKYEYDSHALLTSFIDCVLSNHVNPERQRKRSDQCKLVKRRNEGLALPGSMSFSKSHK
ncbi:hypothetical protein XENTR_v10015675 [Xenopus tropicalis]|uniref:Retinoic acid receptor responder protein 2-like isoform X1 n=1 Tax=Xenopus tropicalis TaxID=8364 RepID=A0A8J1JQT8_XENTR|nr:retinoic acid receptor responder protein 2-like isoform X1 [Xenopus tropicalis]KAE8595281.1 hypothetical protein XENTR_v10015675 [Xenopus tropicalis]KAE8595282.1 hypothetical protein XENTR_v10015675 [Xenopus tropicalis]